MVPLEGITRALYYTIDPDIVCTHLFSAHAWKNSRTTFSILKLLSQHLNTHACAGV